MASSIAPLPGTAEQSSAVQQPLALIFLTALWVAVYFPVLVSLGGSWLDTRADMQHGLAVPFVVGYIIWSIGSHLARVTVARTHWGAVLVVWGVVQSSVSMIGEWTFLIRTGMLITGIGCIVSLYGVRILRPLAYPLMLLLFMIPPPSFAYSALTLRLQLLASQFAETVLEGVGYSVLREGNVLEMAGIRWSVVEACSGIRSLVTLSFFFFVYNYLLVTNMRIRVLLLAALIPIAILGNAMRIVLTVVVGQYDREAAVGMMHEASGYVVVGISALACIALHQVLEKVYQRA